MKSVEVKISNRLGLHARAAAKFVHLANEFKASISVSKAGSRVNGKSILGLLTLAAAKGSTIHVAAEGVDQDLAIERLQELIVSRFGEES